MLGAERTTAFFFASLARGSTPLGSLAESSFWHELGLWVLGTALETNYS